MGNGGFIACFGEVEAILPTYIYDTTYTPSFMRLYLMQLGGKLGINEALEFIDVPFRRYRGDIAVGGNSELLIVKKK